jgi:hypothetical protein
METLEFEKDMFGGVVVTPEKLPDAAAEFSQRLQSSLETWRDQGIRLAWIDIPREKSHLIPLATQSGFFFHHANEDDLMLVARLVEDAFVPNHATHYIGVGGVCINHRQEILVVCERHRRTSQPYYKLCFRHWHGYRYGKSDIYFVCRLAPLSQDVTMQAEEIEECFWMPVADYFGSDLVSTFNKRIVRAALNSPGVMPEWIDGYADPARYEFFMPRDNDAVATGGVSDSSDSSSRPNHDNAAPPSAMTPASPHISR